MGTILPAMSMRSSWTPERRPIPTPRRAAPWHQGQGSASKAMTLTDNVTITDLNVKVTLYHTRYADLKFELIGPDNVTRSAL